MQYFFILLFLIGCGTEKVVEEPNHSIFNSNIPQKNWGDFSNYVDDFMAVAKIYGKDRDARIDALKTIKVVDTLVAEKEAECERICYDDDNTLAYTQISITQDTVNQFLGEPVFRFIMFHELAHCLLNMQHTTTENSLMYPITPFYPSKKDVNSAIKEFFNNLPSVDASHCQQQSIIASQS